MLRECFGIEIVSVMQIDVLGITFVLCELLVAADVKYLLVVHNYVGRLVLFFNGGQLLRWPFCWCAPSGCELLVWYIDSLYGIAYMEGNFVGFVESYEDMLEHLLFYLYVFALRLYLYGAGMSGWLIGILVGMWLMRVLFEHDLLHLCV